MMNTNPTMAFNRGNKEADGTTITMDVDSKKTTESPAETTEVLVEDSGQKSNRHIFDMRVEFTSDARNAADTFSIVPAVKKLHDTTTGDKRRTDFNAGQYEIFHYH